MPNAERYTLSSEKLSARRCQRRSFFFWHYSNCEYSRLDVSNADRFLTPALFQPWILSARRFQRRPFWHRHYSNREYSRRDVSNADRFLTPALFRLWRHRPWKTTPRGCGIDRCRRLPTICLPSGNANVQHELRRRWLNQKHPRSIKSVPRKKNMGTCCCVCRRFAFGFCFFVLFFVSFFALFFALFFIFFFFCRFFF